MMTEISTFNKVMADIDDTIYDMMKKAEKEQEISWEKPRDMVNQSINELYALDEKQGVPKKDYTSTHYYGLIKPKPKVAKRNEFTIWSNLLKNMIDVYPSIAGDMGVDAVIGFNSKLIRHK